MAALSLFDLLKWAVTPAAIIGVFWWWRDTPIVRKLLIRSDLRTISFEIENVSGKLTSLDPTIRLVAYSNRTPQRYTFRIQIPDRSLEPHKTKVVEATHADTENRLLYFVVLMKFSITLTRGRNATVLCLDAALQPVPWYVFYWHLFVFRIFNRLPRSQAKRLTDAGRARELTDAQQTLIAGPTRHPSLHIHEHRRAVVECQVNNPSDTQVAFIREVQVFAYNGDVIPVTWSNAIDEFGNPAESIDLIGIPPGMAMIVYVRHVNQDPITFARIVIKHSMPGSPLIATFG